ncbi:MAG: L-fucose/L-arabinose isomerase family protein [Muribaculaceae bacterium]|nr:L-fucose/L-arabinose isomerase family protein [Muribaculaceae bacterium]
MGTKLNVGLISVGLDTYWNQFHELLPHLMQYHDVIKGHLKNDRTEVLDAGMVDSVPKSVDAAQMLTRGGVDVLFVFISTYALSSTLLPVVQNVKVPVILLNVQPTAAIDYDKINSLADRSEMTGMWLENCQACSLPEFACVLNNAGISYSVVTGFLGDATVWQQVDSWLDAAFAVKGMNGCTMGILGHYYNGMLDVYTDLRKQCSTFGTKIELIEMCELKALRDSVDEQSISAKIKEFSECFDVVTECSDYELRRAAKVSVALDKMIANHGLGSLAYYYEGQPGNDYQDIITSIIPGCTILTGNGVPVAGECEVKNVQAMKIMSLLNAGGSFSEFYAMDFNDDVVLLGHDGPAHFNMSEEKVKLVPVPVYHGKPGKGLSIQMSVSNGLVTLLSVVEKKDGLSLLCAEGESVSGPVLNIGNTNSRYRFDCGLRKFIEQWSSAGPSHHCAIGVGHIAEKLEKVAFLLGIPIEIVK